MQKFEPSAFNHMLSIVGTPIGNLGDLSPRAADAIVSAAVILTEDTRSFQTILRHAQTLAHSPLAESQKIISYYKEVEYEKLSSVMEYLESDVNVVLVSEAGMPAISDPGLLLVKTCHTRGIKVTIIPGPSAVDAAVALAGMPHKQYMFLGFLPKKENDMQRMIERCHTVSELFKGDTVFVAFESPLRCQDTVTAMYSWYPSLQITVCREMTKLYEEVIHQPPPTMTYQGEIVLLFSFTA